MPDSPSALPLVHRVLAGPGSGKTRLLIRELRHRLEHGYPPASLLGITFTRRAAHEMRTRLRAPLLHGEAEIVAIAPWIGTFHALARRIQAETGRLRQPLDLDTLIPEATTTLQEGALPSWIPALRFIAVDEAQDLDSTQIRFLLELRRHASSCELLVVGDPDQCLPPGTRIATPNGWQSIETLHAGHTVLGTGGTPSLLQGEVRAIRETHWTGPLWVVRAGGRILRGTPHHLVPVRFHPLPGLHYVYLMQRADRGYRIGVTRSLRSSDARHPAQPGFRIRFNQEHGDKLWILKTCSSYVEARYYEAFYAAQYGLPTTCFHGQGRNLQLDEKWIQKLYHALDTHSRAQRLLADLRIHPEFPHHLPQNGVSRESASLIMFGNPATPVHRHVITWSSIRPDTIERLRAAGYSLSLNRGRYATFKAQRSHYAEALNLAKDLAAAGHLSLRRRIRIAGRLYDLMPLSHLHPGMRVLTQEADRLVEVQVEAVNQEAYDGPVFDLEVKTLHTYTASSWLVHNSIYGFRGASPRFLLDPETYFAKPVRTLTLSENHRSARRIVETARAILSPSSSPLAPCHTLIPTRPEAHPAIRHLTADSREEEAALILSEVRTMLAVGVRLSHQAILVRTRAQLAPLRQEATRWTLPIYTPPADERLDGPRPHAVPEDALTVLTIHQAKGGEWTVVYLAGCQDGLLPHVAAKTHEAYEEERRLLYVAVTRAKQLLWICRHGPPSPFLEATLRDPFDLTKERDIRHRTVEHREGWLKRVWGWIAVT